MAGAIAELARVALRHDFRNIDPRDARIVLVEAGPRVLAAFPPILSESRAALARAAGRRGAARHAGHAVRRRRRGDRRRAAGSGDDRLGRRRRGLFGRGMAGRRADRAGRVMVGADLSLPGHPEIFVIGDTAHAPGADGKPLPGLAPVAKQQGAYVARVLPRRIAGSRRPDRSAIATTASWPRSAGAPRSRISAGSSSTAPSPGCCGAPCTSSFLIGFRNRRRRHARLAVVLLTFQSRRAADHRTGLTLKRRDCVRRGKCRSSVQSLESTE